ncbi:hypothetical protein ACQBAR_16520 [Propionibacteriaceae bacterium Y1685]
MPAELPPLPEHVRTADRADLAAHWELMARLREGLDEQQLDGVPMALVFPAVGQNGAADE